MKAVRRNTTRRDRHRKIIARGKPPCHLCLEEIDYAAHWLDPLAFVIDHIIPLAKGGKDILENLGAAHRKCNRAKGDGGKPPKPAITFVTERRW